MRHIWILAGIALALACTSCTENYTDEQMEVAAMMNKGGKADKSEKVKQTKNEKNGIMLCGSSKTKETKLDKALTGKGKDKNAKNGVEPCSEEMTTRSMIIYKPFPSDKPATKDIPPTLRPLR